MEYLFYLFYWDCHFVSTPNCLVMKNLSVISKLVRPEARSALAKQLKVTPKTIEAVLKGQEENDAVFQSLIQEAGKVLATLVAEYGTLTKTCTEATQPPAPLVDPVHGTQVLAATFVQPLPQGIRDAEEETKENPNPHRPVVIRSRSWEESERLAKVVAGLSPYQFDFIKGHNGTYSSAYDHDLDLLAACFTLHQQGYSKNGVVIFMKQNALSVFDQEKAYSILQRLQGDYIQHIRLAK